MADWMVVCSVALMVDESVGELVCPWVDWRAGQWGLPRVVLWVCYWAGSKVDGMAGN